MAIVFRLEENNGPEIGVGVYRCSNHWIGSHLAEGMADNHPLPQHDPKLNVKLNEVGGNDWVLHNYFPQRYVFGFESLEALGRWFTGLHKHHVVDRCEGSDIRIAAYRTDDVLFGTFQCCFDKYTAELIEEYELDYFL